MNRNGKSFCGFFDKRRVESSRAPEFFYSRVEFRTISLFKCLSIYLSAITPDNIVRFRSHIRRVAVNMLSAILDHLLDFPSKWIETSSNVWLMGFAKCNEPIDVRCRCWDKINSLPRVEEKLIKVKVISVNVMIIAREMRSGKRAKWNANGNSST